MAKRRRKLRPLTPLQSFTLAMILASNLIPVVGVMWLRWRIFDVFFLYWLENIYVGIQSKRRIIRSGGRELVEFQNAKFTETYIVFMIAHFVMLCVFFPKLDFTRIHRPAEFFTQLFFTLKDSIFNVAWAAIFIILNRFFSWKNNVQAPEGEISLNDELNAAGGRLLVLQFALIAGAFCAFMNASRIGIWAMAFMKTLFDLDEQNLLGVSAEEKKKTKGPPLKYIPK